MANGTSLPPATLPPHPSTPERAASIGERHGLPASVLLGVLMVLVVLVAFLGNLLVCMAVAANQPLRKNSYFFMVSLAVSDLLLAALVMTLAIYNDFQGHWSLGGALCRLWVSTDIMCCTASILNLSLIALDRYLYVRDPFAYVQWMSPRKVLALISGVWGVSALISFLPSHLGLNEARHMHHPGLSQDACYLNINSVYALLSSAVSFYLPCVLMVAIYVRLFLYARHHAKRIHSLAACTLTAMGHNYIRRSYKAALTLGVIMGAFLLCWLPFFIVNPADALCHGCVPEETFRSLTWLGYFNSCLNPIIYSLFNTELRAAFKRILCGTPSQGNGAKSLADSARTSFPASTLDTGRPRPRTDWTHTSTTVN